MKITCKDAHGLLSESMDHKLSLWTTVRLRTHLWLCSACSRVETQFSTIRNATRKLGQ